MFNLPQISTRNEMRILNWGHIAQITLVLTIIVLAFVKIGSGNVRGRSDVWGLSVVSSILASKAQANGDRESNHLSFTHIWSVPRKLRNYENGTASKLSWSSILSNASFGSSWSSFPACRSRHVVIWDVHLVDWQSCLVFYFC